MIAHSVRLVLLLPLLFLPQTGTATPPDEGVFFPPHRVNQYREIFATNAVFADLRHQLDTIDRERERKFVRSEVRYNDHLYDIARVGNLAQQMALVYLYTGDADAAALARECVETLMKFPKWDYFLEGGTDVIGLQRAPNSAIAVALVVEALGNRIAPDVRRQWLQTMAARGTEPSYLATYGMRHPDRVKGWSMDTTSTYLTHRPFDRGLSFARWPIILNTINLKAIPASALALSALVYRKYLGENKDTRRWLEQATYSIGTFRDIYARDGSYNEGVSYAHYTTLHLIQAVDALQRTGIADLTDMLNWQGYQDFLLAMTLPTSSDPHAIVNFSDAGAGAHASPSFWISGQKKDGLAQWFGENLAVSRDIWSVLYYDASVAPSPPPERPSLWLSELDWVVGRTGYKPEDLVVAMRSGGPFNHEHADRNGLIVKCYGEKLIVDPMRPPYSRRDPSWKMRLTAGHSCVLIDGKGHQYVDGSEGTNASQASASIIRHSEREGYFFWTSDATPAYKRVIPDVRSVTRTVVTLTGLPAVVVIDKIIKENEPSTIQARFFADNIDGQGAVSVFRGGFKITRPNAVLQGQGNSNARTTLAAGLPDIPADNASRHPFVDVATIDPQKEICLVTALIPSPSSGKSVSMQVDRDGMDYVARFSSGMRSATVRVADSGVVPEFEIELR